MPAHPTAPAGRHVLAELTGADPALLDDAATLRAALRTALTDAGATVLQVVAETFAPQGVTVVALLAESHASVHTWPEHGTAHVDVFTCGASADPERAARAFAAAVGAASTMVQVLDRGGPQREIVEPIAPGLTRRWELGAVRHAATTPYQRVLIADTAHGVTLFCDDVRRSAEATQLGYHEALFVPAALLARRRERVLVIGAGEGVVSLLAVAAGATVVDHVDIDRDCVRACAEHLPYGYPPAALAAAERHDGPVRMHYVDGAAFVEAAAGRADADGYDVIVLDLPDERPGATGARRNRLHDAGFLARCRALLAPGGVVVSPAGGPGPGRSAALHAARARFHEVFSEVVHHGGDEHESTFLLGRTEATADPVGEMVAGPPAPDR